MGVVSSVYKLKPAKNCLLFASARETPATSAINRAFVSATPINHTYSQLTGSFVRSFTHSLTIVFHGMEVMPSQLLGCGMELPWGHLYCNARATAAATPLLHHHLAWRDPNWGDSSPQSHPLNGEAVPSKRHHFTYLTTLTLLSLTMT